MKYFFILLMFATTAGASGSHSPTNITNNYYTTENYYATETTEMSDISSLSIAGGISESGISELFAYSAAIAQHNFDYSTLDWQGSVGGSFYNGESAVSFAVGKRFNGLKALINASYGQVLDHSIIGVGATFRF